MIRYKIISLLVLLNYCSGLNILVVYPHSGKSHFLVFEPLFKALANKGHNVTVISYFPQKNPLPNYRDIDLQSPSLDVSAISLETLPQSRLLHYLCPFLISSFAENDCLRGLRNRNFIRFIKEDNKFDIILTEVFNTNCFMGLVKKYEVPFIGLSSCVIQPWATDWIGSPYHPGYVPNILMDYSDKLTLIERIENTFMYFYSRVAFKYRMEIPGNELSKKFLRQDILKDGNILYNMSLLLTNTHFSLNLPRPLVPADIEVGGIHIGTPKRLPLHLEKWINESSNGIIYFSLGSLIKGHTLPRDKLNAFMKVFQRLPQRVLWKWENGTMDGKPENIMIDKWMPQFDILCHPNVKAFISHGGLLGTTEAVHCGVPVVVMPQLGDQFTNARALEKSGGGVILHLKDATETTIQKSLTTVLSDHFRQNVKKLSERFRDRPLPPMETAIYWVEYVAAHKGAPHMRSAAIDMPFYQYYLLDVALAFLLIFSLFIHIIYVMLSFFSRIVIKLTREKIKKFKVE